MRRYIVFSIGPEEGGRIEGSVDDLDDIYGADVEVVDTRSGMTYIWIDNDWELAGDIDEKEIINVQRKSEQALTQAVAKEEIGGFLIPASLERGILDKAMAASVALIERERI